MGGGEGLDGDHALRSPMSWDASGAGFSPAAAAAAADPAAESPRATTALPAAAAAGGVGGPRAFRAAAANRAECNAAAQRAGGGACCGLHAAYRALIRLRRARPSLARGRLEAAWGGGGAVALVLRRSAERTAVVLNYAAAAAAVSLHGLPPGAALVPLHVWPDLPPPQQRQTPPGVWVGPDGAAEVGVPPLSVQVRAAAPWPPLLLLCKRADFCWVAT